MDTLVAVMTDSLIPTWERLRDVIGAPEESVLIDRITSEDPLERMPPKGKPLSAKQIAKLTAWIKDGAPYEKHWSFQPPKAPTQPAVRDQSWPASKLDYFILKRIEQAGLKPSPEAKPAVLLRFPPSFA